MHNNIAVKLVFPLTQKKLNFSLPFYREMSFNYFSSLNNLKYKFKNNYK